MTCLLDKLDGEWFSEDQRAFPLRQMPVLDLGDMENETGLVTRHPRLAI